jgi:hypothetical protein
MLLLLLPSVQHLCCRVETGASSHSLRNHHPATLAAPEPLLYRLILLLHCLVLQVLQRMGYLERDQSVTMKGRVACEVNSGEQCSSAAVQQCSVHGDVHASCMADVAQDVARCGWLLLKCRCSHARSLPVCLPQ